MNRSAVIVVSVIAVVIVAALGVWIARRPPHRQVEHISVEIISPPPPPPANAAK